MQIVIEIDEEYYHFIKRQVAHGITNPLKTCVARGIQLPKGHGRLIDADELKKEYPHNTDWDYPVNTNCYVVESIDNSPTIIEADKAESEE